MKMQLKRLLSCVLSLALLISVCSAGPVMDFLSTAVAAATIDEHVAQMTQLVSDSFDGDAPSVNWTSVGNDLHIDSENEILEVGITNGAMQSLAYTFAQPTTNNIFVSYKYKIENAARRQAVYVYGQNSSGKSKTVASFDINYNAISYYYNDPGTKSVKLVSYGASSNWHELKMLFNTMDNSVMVWLDGTYVGAAPYRDAPDMVNITSVSIAGASFTTAPTKSSYMDDVAICEMGTSGVTEISEAPMNEGFDAAALPANLWTYSATGASIVERDDANGNALQLKATSTAQAQANFALPAAIATGNVKLSFDYYVTTDDATRIASTQFRLSDGSGKVSLTVDLQGEHFNNYNSDTSAATKTINVIQKGSGWHTIVFDLNLDQRNFTVAIDGKAVPTTTNGEDFLHSMRNPSTAKGLKTGYFAVVGNADEAKRRTFQIDNFRIEYDSTCYGLLQLKAPADLVVSKQNKLVYGATNYTAGQLLPLLGCGTPNSVISITDAEGNVRADNDQIQYDDQIVVANTATGEKNIYTVKVEYTVEFRGIEVNSKEYFEADAIELPGEATVRAVIRNYTQEEKVIDVYGAVVGAQTYDEDTKTQITLPKNSYAYAKLNLTIPDNVADAQLKLQVTSGDTKLCNTSKPIATSQECSMPSIFSDGMVLQREANVNIFGLAPTGSKVAVTFGDYTASGVAEDAQFCVQLPQMPACNTGKALQVVVTNAAGTEPLLDKTFTDVVVGDVFYGSGQSNMAQSVTQFAGTTLEEALGEVPNVRMYNATVVTSVANKANDSWTSENPTGSATMYAIAAALRNYGIVDASVPIGYVKCACGASYIQDWMSADDVEALDNYWTTSYIEGAKGTSNERKTDFYYAMVQNVVPYTFKAAVWYQGEANATDENYDEEVKMLIETMREDFGYEIPYFIVQLPGYGERNGWDEFRLVQWNIQNIVPNTSVVVINDTGVENDIHPADKDIVGERIARHIIAKVYGRTDVAYEGPVCDVATVNGATVTVSFKNVNKGPYGSLCSLAEDNSLTGFELSEDGVTYVTAAATISGDTVVLTSELAAPKYVRFGYVNTPIKSLGTNNTDSIGTYQLPCAPFVAQTQKPEDVGGKDDDYGLPEDDFPDMNYKHAYNGGYVVLREDADLIGSSLTEDLYIDLNGHSATGMIVTNGYKVYGMDSATNQYSSDGMGYFTCVDEYGNAIVPEKLYTNQENQRYMTIETESGYTFHRFYLGITNIRLVPRATGFGYTAEFYGDEMVQTQIQSVGYKLWIAGNQEVSRATNFKNTVTLLLKDFNVEKHGETLINACATMTLTDGTVLESATASYSMRQIVENINESYSSFTEEKLAAVREMIETYPIMKTWNVDNI